MQAILKKLLLFFFLIMLSNCNTVTGTVEGTAIGIYKDIKTTHHYTTCIFTRVECGDLDLEN
tara:strand:- start:366 stop:551 length:186 start_codon:yes stop_codon:yes gene_type:complete